MIVCHVTKPSGNRVSLPPDPWLRLTVWVRTIIEIDPALFCIVYSWELRTWNRKVGTGNWEQGTGNQEQGTGNGEQGTGNLKAPKLRSHYCWNGWRYGWGPLSRLIPHFSALYVNTHIHMRYVFQPREKLRRCNIIFLSSLCRIKYGVKYFLKSNPIWITMKKVALKVTRCTYKLHGILLDSSVYRTLNNRKFLYINLNAFSKRFWPHDVDSSTLKY